jgi:hypothetical protein
MANKKVEVAVPKDEIVTWFPTQLPSLGLYYDGKCPDGMVEITPWTTYQEEMIVRFSANDSYGLIDKLVAGNVKLPNGLTQDDLLVTDRFYLLFQLRVLSLVPQYTFLHACPRCGTEHHESVDISKLPPKSPKEEDTEPFELALPRCKKTITLKLLRTADEKAMMRYEADKLKKDPSESGSPALRFKLARQIEKINGEAKVIQEKIDFVRSLNMLDYRVIQNCIEEHESGLNTEIITACPKSGCGYKDTWEIPLQITFFRPLGIDLRTAI